MNKKEVGGVDTSHRMSGGSWLSRRGFLVYAAVSSLSAVLVGLAGKGLSTQAEPVKPGRGHNEGAKDTDSTPVDYRGPAPLNLSPEQRRVMADAFSFPDYQTITTPKAYEPLAKGIESSSGQNTGPNDQDTPPVDYRNPGPSNVPSEEKR